MKKNRLKLFEHEITFSVLPQYKRIHIRDFLKLFLKQLSSVQGIVKKLKISKKTSLFYNRHRVRKNPLRKLYKTLPLEHLYTFNVKLSTAALMEFMHNLKLRRVTGFLTCLKQFPRARRRRGRDSNPRYFKKYFSLAN